MNKGTKQWLSIVTWGLIFGSFTGLGFAVGFLIPVISTFLLIAVFIGSIVALMYLMNMTYEAFFKKSDGW